jgi:hypothetical protein
MKSGWGYFLLYFLFSAIEAREQGMCAGLPWEHQRMAISH